MYEKKVKENHMLKIKMITTNKQRRVTKAAEEGTSSLPEAAE